VARWFLTLSQRGGGLTPPQLLIARTIIRPQ
jgi:hypothetical protein